METSPKGGNKLRNLAIAVGVAATFFALNEVEINEGDCVYTANPASWAACPIYDLTTEIDKVINYFDGGGQSETDF